MTNATNVKSMKRIHKVTIRRMVDEADNSWLGEYTSKPTSEYSIDRAHAEDCQSFRQSAKDAIEQLERVIAYLETVRQLGAPPENIYWAAADESQDVLMALQQELGECDCGERGDMQRDEYRYFNPSFNYVDKTGNATDGNTPEEIRKYVRQDYKRMESMNRGDWRYIGIRADAELNVPSGHLAFIAQDVTSGGLWGIESDSDDEYLANVEQEELSSLRGQLRELGFSQRAISAAFRNVERE